MQKRVFLKEDLRFGIHWAKDLQFLRSLLPWTVYYDN